MKNKLRAIKKKTSCSLKKLEQRDLCWGGLNKMRGRRKVKKRE